MRSFIFAILVLTAASSFAGPMYRVISVKDSHTVVVDQNGTAAEVRLAGVIVPLAEEELARTYLRETLVSHWVMLEADFNGAYVYRSPDALYVNGELARRAYTTQRTAMVYLGEVDPGPVRAAKASPAPKAVKVLPPAKPHSVRHKPSGASRIPKP